MKTLIALILLFVMTAVGAADCPAPVSDCLKITWKHTEHKFVLKSQITGGLSFDLDGILDADTGAGIDVPLSTWIFAGESKILDGGITPEAGWFAVVFNAATRRFDCVVPVKID